jgi:tRNA threonylcarbamoyladenosine modification (KEOPS) complex Cgi121 subunit
LLKYIEQDGKYVKITGFRNVNIGDARELVKSYFVDKQQNVCVQFFNAELVATWEHLYFAVLNALLAYRNERNISKTLAMETMIYASTQRQIRKAIALLGVKSDSANIATVIIGDRSESVQTALLAVKKLVCAEMDETVLELTQEKVLEICKVFGVYEKELEAVMKKNNIKRAIVDLVIERMALLQTQI